MLMTTTLWLVMMLMPCYMLPWKLVQRSWVRAITEHWLQRFGTLNCKWCYFSVFSVRLFSVLRGHSLFSSRHNGQWPPTSKDFFLSQIVSITSIFLSSERANIFPFECSVLNKVTTATIFIMSLVWRGPWLGIEPGTSRTRSTIPLGYRRGGAISVYMCGMYVLYVSVLF